MRNMYGICTGYVRDMYGICTGYKCDIYKTKKSRFASGFFLFIHFCEILVE